MACMDWILLLLRQFLSVDCVACSCLPKRHVLIDHALHFWYYLVFRKGYSLLN